VLILDSCDAYGQMYGTTTQGYFDRIPSTSLLHFTQNSLSTNNIGIYLLCQQTISNILPKILKRTERGILEEFYSMMFLI